jgi:hypothetical protein
MVDELPIDHVTRPWGAALYEYGQHYRNFLAPAKPGPIVGEARRLRLSRASCRNGK